MGISKLIGLCIILIISTGCATVTERTSTAQVKIEKGSPVVYVHPASLDPYREASICIPPFVVPANMNITQAERVASLFTEVFLGKRTFPKVKQIMNRFGNTRQAIEVGRRADCDLVLAGSLNYAVEGTELGGARVEVTIRVINTESGNTVWHISQNMNQPIDYPDNSIMKRAVQSLSPLPTRKANGGPALANMLSQIAVDIADVIGGSRYVRR